MVKVNRINISQVEGGYSYDEDKRPNGEIALYNDDNGGFDLVIHDGVNSTNLNKVLGKGKFYGHNADSGDNNGYDTIKLIPDIPAYNNGSDQYLIVDPTGPNHIHIRAGGAQDNSNSELILGGENSHVSIGVGQNPAVYIKSNSSGWIFDVDGGLVFPDGSKQMVAYTGGVSGSGSVDTGDITFNQSTISTLNADQDMIITTNGSGDIYIGADRNMVFDMNAFSGKGIILQDSQEDGYDDINTPSTLKVGRIYHSEGSMVISSDGAIIDASGVQVDTSGNPTDSPVYGGLWMTNGQDTGFLVPAPTGTLGEIFLGANIEIHNNGKIWGFTQDGNISVPESGGLLLDNGTSLLPGTFDNSTGGQNGISLNCYVGYELNWQGGHLKSTTDGGLTSSDILCDSAIAFPGSGLSNVRISNSGITFPDGNTQTSVGITSQTVGISGAIPVYNLVKISQTDYNNLSSIDPNTLYVIV